MKLPFDFEPEEELPGGYCSRVYAAGELVLKVPFQGEELTSGFRAALQLAGTVGPKIHRSDPASGAILMDRVRPGGKLSESTLFEFDQTTLFIDLVRQLQPLPTDDLLPLENYYSEPTDLAMTLLASSPAPVFLHGDLHHENLLENQSGGWTLIDPKGLVGDPCFEAAAWLRNPFSAFSNLDAALSLTQERLVRLEQEFGWHPWRMSGWALVDLGVDDLPPDHPWRIARETFWIIHSSLKSP